MPSVYMTECGQSFSDSALLACNLPRVTLEVVSILLGCDLGKSSCLSSELEGDKKSYLGHLYLYGGLLQCLLCFFRASS